MQGNMLVLCTLSFPTADGALPMMWSPSLLLTLLALVLTVVTTMYRILSSCGHLPPLQEQVMMGGDDLPEVLARCAVMGVVLAGQPPSPASPNTRSNVSLVGSAPRTLPQEGGGVARASDAAHMPAHVPPVTVMVPLAESDVSSNELEPRWQHDAGQLIRRRNRDAEAGSSSQGTRCAVLSVAESLKGVSDRLPFVPFWLQVFLLLRMDYSYVVQGYRARSRALKGAAAARAHDAGQRWRRNVRHAEEEMNHDAEDGESAAPLSTGAREHVVCGVPLSFHTRGEAPLMFDTESGEAVPVAFRDLQRERFDAHHNLLRVDG